MYATSHGDNSSDDETTLVGEQVARVFQSCLDRGEDDTRPASSISIESRSRKQCSIKTTSVSSKSHTISSRAFSWCRLIRRKRPLEERCELRTSL